MSRQSNNPRALPSAFPVIVKIHTTRDAFSFVLTARIEGEERIVSFGSKTLTQQQRQQWSTTELEVRALRYAVRANANVLNYCDYVVESDNSALCGLRSLFSLA